MDEFKLPPTRQAKMQALNPLMGLTILIVEDSRYASESLRLLSLRSGARIRRADCLSSARRHLQVYRPSVAIIDLGLPDGSGLDLIQDLAMASPRLPVILACFAADPHDSAAEAKAAGADGFLAKPIETLAHFQETILRRLPPDLAPKTPHPVAVDTVIPDPIAYREDLTHAIDLLDQPDPPLPYLRPFLMGIAQEAGDRELAEAARGLMRDTRAAQRHALTQKIAEISPRL
ncbi:response regulator [Paracoccaceae bacterium]|nr:response regulator [Paracoccaceae bacterium]